MSNKTEHTHTERRPYRTDFVSNKRNERMQQQQQQHKNPIRFTLNGTTKVEKNEPKIDVETKEEEKKTPCSGGKYVRWRLADKLCHCARRTWMALHWMERERDTYERLDCMIDHDWIMKMNAFRSPDAVAANKTIGKKFIKMLTTADHEKKNEI